MYNCPDVIAELSAFLDDEVAADVRREIESHLGDCRTCEALYDSARKTLRIVTESGTFEVPESLSRKIMARIRSRGPVKPDPDS